MKCHTCEIGDVNYALSKHVNLDMTLFPSVGLWERVHKAIFSRKKRELSVFVHIDKLRVHFPKNEWGIYYIKI